MLDEFELLATVVPLIPTGGAWLLFLLLLLEVIRSRSMGLLPCDDPALCARLVGFLICGDTHAACVQHGLHLLYQITIRFNSPYHHRQDSRT